MIIGIGVDIVEVARLEKSLRRTPTLRDRLFSDAEFEGRSFESLAARFAAKEAVAKVLGAPSHLAWRDAEVVTGERGRPSLVLHGAVAEEAAAQGIRVWHVSLSHDGGMATAMVVAES